MECVKNWAIAMIGWCSVGLTMAGAPTSLRAESSLTSPPAQVISQEIQAVLQEAQLHGVGFEEVRSALEETPPGTLVILDCTRTLMEPVDAVLRYGKWGQLTEAALGRVPSAEEARHLKLLRDWQSKKRLTHPEWPDLLQAAASRGVHIMVMTKHPVGYVDEEFPPFEGIRIQQLRTLGLDFRRTGPDINVNKMRAMLPGRDLSYVAGVLFAPDGMKSPMIQALLQCSKQRFSKVLFIDDSPTQCIDMMRTFQDQPDPSVEVLYYTEANVRRPAVDPSIAAIQLRVLFEEDIWLSDDAAAIRLRMEAAHHDVVHVSDCT